MDEQQLQQQIVQLVQAAMQGDQQANQLILQIMQAAQQGDQQAALIAQYIQQIAQQMQGDQAQSAKFGAKLNYIKYLKGQCPEGYEMQRFANGGKTCKKCEEKKKQAEESDPVKSFKCGRKMKKAACGIKVKKNLKGGTLASFAQATNPDNYRDGKWKRYNPYHLKNGLIVQAELVLPHKYPNGEYYPNVHMSLESVPETGDSTIYVSGDKYINKWTKGKDSEFRGIANLWEKAKKATKLPRK